jgi:hypothetical protein
MASASSRNAKLVRLRLATLSYSHTFTVGLVWLGFGWVWFGWVGCDSNETLPPLAGLLQPVPDALDDGRPR